MWGTFQRVVLVYENSIFITREPEVEPFPMHRLQKETSPKRVLPLSDSDG